MTRIAVLTSGGDAPGMNAAIRAVVRMGVAQGWEVYGVRHGYTGLIAGEMEEMGPRDVSGIIQLGGTTLGSSRCPEFKTEEGRWRAIRELRQEDIDALIVIGGNGSQQGAAALFEMGFPVVGVASTIDNDLAGTEITIGVHSALGIALEAIDRLKTTASSHERAFLVEVMGRKCGYLALMAGLAGGAEAVVIPEDELKLEELAEEIHDAYVRGKSHAIVVVAEGATHDAQAIARHFRENRARLGFQVRVTKLGHVQRGGAPSAYDRILGSNLGAGAVEAIAREEYGVLVGIIDNEVATTPYDQVAGINKPLPDRFVRLAKILAM
jgi:6-phosphofructokinase 1